MLKEQITKHQEVRVVPNSFFQYDKYIQALKKNLPNTIRFPTNQTTFPDGTPWAQVIVGRGFEEDLCQQGTIPVAYLPFWISGQFGPMAEVFFEVEQIGNALTHTERGRPPLVDTVVGITPYLEARQDKDSLSKDKKRHKVGEANNVEIIANGLHANGIKKLVTLHIHSYEAAKAFIDAGIELLDLTLEPLYSQYLTRNHLIKPETAFVALDKGGILHSLYLCLLTGLDPKDHLIIFDKSRPGITGIDKMTLLWGNPKDKELIILEDMLDSASSLKNGGSQVKEMGSKNGMIFLATHGILSYPARDNIQSLLDQKILSRLVISDSLPGAAFGLEGVSGKIDIIKTASLMASAARLMATLPTEEVLNNKAIKPFIMQQRDKEKVWQEFYNKYSSQNKINNSSSQSFLTSPTVNL